MSFKLRRLSVRGASVQDADLIFLDGLNVITGPSNTGKSYIYQCINYMLGSSKAPKNIKQAKNYTNVYLEIETENTKIYTLESDLKGGAFRLYEIELDKLNENSKFRVLNRKSNTEEKDNISTFLLALNNLQGSKIRKNAKGGKRSLSYRDIAKLTLIDENKIIGDKSPILTGQYTTVTEEENVMKLLLTGQDDSAVIESLSKDQVTNKKGKIELLTTLIDQTLKDLSQYSNETDAESRLEFLEKSIQSLSGEHIRLKDSFVQLDGRRKELSLNLSAERSHEIYYNELISRYNILKEQYNTDINRLKATIEVSQLLLAGHTNDAYCPVCKGQLKTQCSDDDIVQVVKSCEAEVEKIINLRHELYESGKLIEDKKDNVTIIVNKIEADIQSITTTLDNDVSKNLSTIIDKINELNSVKNSLYEFNYLSKKVEELIQQKNILENSLDKPANVFQNLSSAVVDDLAQIVKNVLTGCNYPDLTTVSYSEEKKDFVISGEDRELFGKGYRAITYAAFIIALQKLVVSKNYSIGTPVLDSPLVTYRKPTDDKNETIPVDLAMNFYRYVAKSSDLPQVIILENEEPPEDINASINHIKFTRVLGTGRYGFFPQSSSN